jgi:hypothetical protein
LIGRNISLLLFLQSCNIFYPVIHFSHQLAE